MNQPPRREFNIEDVFGNFETDKDESQEVEFDSGESEIDDEEFGIEMESGNSGINHEEFGTGDGEIE